MRQVACVIPAYDAAATLEAVVSGLRVALPDAILIVVDDGSSDATHDVASACCDRAVRFRANRGKGAALRAGFDVAHAECVHAVITIDADGQHDPSRAPALLAALAEADIVIGTRARTPGAMPIVSAVYRILFEHQPPRAAIGELMRRELRAEGDT